MSGKTQLVFRCDAAEGSRKLEHFWEHTVGSGHATLALRADWQGQLERCHRELGFEHVRFHGILCDSMGTLLREKGKLLYSFHNADLILDFLLSIGMRPFVELSFMPEALASGGMTVFHYGANVTPPKRLGEWSALIGKLAGHWVKRYGVTEVRRWFFEVWNEPNLQAFWPSTRVKYFHFYRATARALKKVDKRLRVGGPATASNEWVGEFLRYCDGHGLPVDFVSTHHYPTDALGNADEDTESQLAHSERSILRRWAQDTRRKVGGRPLYYTEWNVSSNPRDHLHDEPYAAAAIVKTMLEANGLVQGYSFWTFSDIFSENYFPSMPFQGGFGLLTIHGIAKPAYRAFEILHGLGDREIVVDGIHETVDCWAVKGAGKVTVVLTNFALPRHAIKRESVRICVGVPARPREIFVERIDKTHANVKAAWEKMGSPEYLSAEEVGLLERASAMVREPLEAAFADGMVTLDLEMPVEAVAAVTMVFSEEGRR